MYRDLDFVLSYFLFAPFFSYNDDDDDDDLFVFRNMLCEYASFRNMKSMKFLIINQTMCS